MRLWRLRSGVYENVRPRFKRGCGVIWVLAECLGVGVGA